MNQINTLPNQNFFLSPQFPMQRQYEALRAFFVDEEPSGDVARRFGYSLGAFRVLCHQFRHRQPQRGPQSTPARDRVRDLAIAMRKRNLSVYDIQRELATTGHAISINTLTVLLPEEGFSRLPRRADDERPPTVKPRLKWEAGRDRPWPACRTSSAMAASRSASKPTRRKTNSTSRLAS